MRKLNSRELATVLAALRYWQRHGLPAEGSDNHAPEDDIATNGGTLSMMQPKEIDVLCEALNFAAEPTNEQREELAEAALNAYGDAHPDYKDAVIIFSTLVVDLMSDLRHYCGANGIDFDDCVRISEGHHVEEVAKG